MDIDELLGLEGGGATSRAQPSRPSRFAPKAAGGGRLQPSSKAKQEVVDDIPPVSVKEEARPEPEIGEPMDEDRSNNGAEDQIDNGAEEENSVVCEYDVYFNPPSRDSDSQLYVLQYPLRPAWRPYDLDQRCTEVRIRPKGAEVQVDLTIDKYLENYDSQSPAAVKLETQTLSSSGKQSLTARYAVGVLRDRKLHLNPIHAVVQLRPWMEYLNSGGSKKRNIPEVSVKVEDATKAAVAGSSKRQNKKNEPEVSEPWVPLKYHGMESALSVSHLQKMMEEASSPLPFSMSPCDYMSSLCPGANAKKAKSNGPSIRSLLSLPLEKRLEKRLAEGPSVQRFSTLRHLAPDDPVEDFLRALKQKAHLVQGLWIAKTGIRCPNAPGSEALLRDYILLLFSRSTSVKISELSSVLGTRLNTEYVKKLLNEFAVQRESCKDWKFKEHTDTSFIKGYPNIVKEQEERWKNGAKNILESMPRGKNSSTLRGANRINETAKQGISHSDKVPIKVASDVSARKATMPDEIREALLKGLKRVFQNCKVCSFHTICQGLRDLAVNTSAQPKVDARLVRAVKFGIEAPQEELQAVISEIAVNVHGVYVLKSSSDHPEFDPLRNVVIDLLVGKGSNAKLKKAEVIEAAKIKLQKEPTSNEFSKVMTELCESKGGAWVFKSGDGAPK